MSRVGELRAHAEHPVRQRPQGDHRQHAGGDEALVQRAHDRLVGAEADEEGADDRGDHTHRAHGERIEHQVGDDRLAVEVDRRQHHGRDHGHRIGLEQVGRHAGAVADVVADVVGDGRGVARIVLGDAGLDLADEITADVGALGEDAAAETGEDGDEGGAEAERHQGVDHGAAGRVEAHADGEDGVVDGDAQQREAGHQQARHRAGAEGHGETLGERAGGGLRRAHVGAHRHQHADEASRARQHRADQEADGDQPAQQRPDDDEDHDAGDGDGGVLAREIGLRAFLDGGGDLLHARRAGVGCHHRPHRVGAIDDREQSATDDCPHYSTHCRFPLKRPHLGDRQTRPHASVGRYRLGKPAAELESRGTMPNARPACNMGTSSQRTSGLSEVENGADCSPCTPGPRLTHCKKRPGATLAAPGLPPAALPTPSSSAKRNWSQTVAFSATGSAGTPAGSAGAAVGCPCAAITPGTPGTNTSRSRRRGCGGWKARLAWKSQ